MVYSTLVASDNFLYIRIYDDDKILLLLVLLLFLSDLGGMISKNNKTRASRLKYRRCFVGP